MRKNVGIQFSDSHAFFAFCSLFLLITSCTTLVSWAPDYTKKTSGTVRLDISVYKTGGIASIEEDLRTLASFFLLKNGLFTANEGEKADFTMEIQAHEREYQSGWDVKRSISLSVRFFDSDGSAIAAAQVINNRGILSDARKLKRMLSIATRFASKKLAKTLKKSGK
jgi:hypothetical protein